MTEPRHISAAIVELGHDVVTRAWHYLLDWHALERAGVPAHTRRRALLVPPLATDLQPIELERTVPLNLCERWAARGTGGVLIGSPGTGKSLAAARWLLAFARLGRSVVWAQAGGWKPGKDHDRDRERVLAASVVVLDDVGRGAVSGWLLDTVNELACLRLDAGKPTIVISNLARYTVKGLDRPRALLDDPTADRYSGRVECIDGDSLRTSEPDGEPGEDLDSLRRDGRGRAWLRAAEIIELVGAHDRGSTRLVVGQGARWGLDESERPEFGLALTVRLASLTRTHDAAAAALEARRACRVLGIDAAQASARAREIEATSTDVDANAAMAEAMLAALERDVPRRPRSEPRAEPRSLEQQREHDAALRATRERFGDAPARTWSVPALRGVGYRVERGREGWTLKHLERELADKISTESAAWEYAAQLQTPQE